MVTIKPIELLRQTVQKVGDPNLQSELLGRVSEVQRNLAAVTEHAHSQRGEIERLRAQLSATAGPAGCWTTPLYDPPV